MILFKSSQISIIHLCILCWCICTFSGCGENPQIQAENRTLVVAMATLVASQDLPEMNEMSVLIKDKFNQGEMSKAEFQAFDEIIALSLMNQWKAAQDQISMLQNSQKPQKEDLERITRKQLPEMKQLTRKNKLKS